MEIPKTNRKPKSINPNTMIIYSTYKAGKTVICSQLVNHLMVELEPGGADYVESRVIEINKASEFNNLLDTLEKSKEKVCDYLIVDTTTKLDEWSEIVGTYDFMSKMQGKKFNRNEKGEVIYHTSKEFETIHSLPNGNGYQFSRNVMVDWYDRLLNLITLKKVSHIILLAHIKDKQIESKSGNLVDTIDINLTGKVKSIFASRVDAIAYFYRKGKQGILNFSNDYKVVCGGRCRHLTGEIVVSEKQDDDSIKTYWDRIYLKE
jgi:prolyl oligopeptidase PreP (S9A serine peptidase family)